MTELKAQFRPEFLNRLDDVIMFSALGREQIVKIVDVQLAIVQQRLRKKDIDLEVSQAAKDKLANDGYDPLYGARPLKRLIQREVVDRMARAVLQGALVRGGTVRVSLKDGDFAIDTTQDASATQARADA